MDDGYKHILSVPCCFFVFLKPPLSNQLSGGPPEWGPPTTPGGGPERLGLRFDLQGNFLIFLFWRSGAAITTVDQSDIRGLGTGLS